MVGPLYPSRLVKSNISTRGGVKPVGLKPVWVQALILCSHTVTVNLFNNKDDQLDLCSVTKLKAMKWIYTFLSCFGL